MERNEISQAIKKIIVSVLKHDNFEMKDELLAFEVNGWDSLTHMVIVFEIEAFFQIKFKLKDLNGLNSMGSLIDLVTVKLIQK